jgi:hypothetical protein
MSKDYEQNPLSSLAWIRFALVSMLVHRLGLLKNSAFLEAG